MKFLVRIFLVMVFCAGCASQPAVSDLSSGEEQGAVVDDGEESTEQDGAIFEDVADPAVPEAPETPETTEALEQPVAGEPESGGPIPEPYRPPRSWEEAIETGDPELCPEDDHNTWVCVTDVALAQEDAEICDSLTEGGRNRCRMVLAATLGLDICPSQDEFAQVQSHSAEGLYYGCIVRLAEAETDSSYCARLSEEQDVRDCILSLESNTLVGEIAVGTWPVPEGSTFEAVFDGRSIWPDYFVGTGPEGEQLFSATTSELPRLPSHGGTEIKFEEALSFERIESFMEVISEAGIDEYIILTGCLTCSATLAQNYRLRIEKETGHVHLLSGSGEPYYSPDEDLYFVWEATGEHIFLSGRIVITDTEETLLYIGPEGWHRDAIDMDKKITDYVGQLDGLSSREEDILSDRTYSGEMGHIDVGFKDFTDDSRGLIFALSINSEDRQTHRTFTLQTDLHGQRIELLRDCDYAAESEDPLRCR